MPPRTEAEYMDWILPQIAGRMSADNAADLSDAEIIRTLGPCVCGHQLIPVAIKLRDAGRLSYDMLLPLNQDRPGTEMELLYNAG